MRPTTKSERNLLGVLGLVVLGGVVYFGGGALSRKQAALDLQCASLRADRAEALVDLQDAPVWAARRDWIRRHEPALGEEGDTRAQVLDFVVKGARAHHLEILAQNLVDVQHGPGGAKIGTEIRLKGSMESLCRWLADLQKPDSFYAVDQFSLEADPDQKSMDCTLQVARYFREGAK